MKRITTIFKAIGFIVIVLIMVQGCIPTGNPTPDLIGKIKNIKFTDIDTSGYVYINVKWIFNYDSSGNVNSIDALDSTNSIVFTTTIERQTNKIVIKQGASYEEDYFLQPGTNFIDSIYIPESAGITRILVVRDNTNNIKSISEIHPYPNNSADYTLDSIVYVNNNIVSVNNTNANNYIAIVQYEYNTSILAKPDVRPLIYSPRSSLFLGGIDVEVYGISLGNGSKNLVYRYRTILNDPNVSFETVAYSVYTPTQNVISYVQTWPLSYTTTLENNYY